MGDFSSPGSMAIYTLNSEGDRAGPARLYSFLSTFLSLFSGGDIFPDDFLSKDTFPDYDTFMNKFPDFLSNNILQILTASPATFLIAFIGISFSFFSFVATIFFFLRLRAVPKTNLSSPRKLKLHLPVVFLVFSLGGCVWVMQENKMVNDGLQRTPQVSATLMNEV